MPAKAAAEQPATLLAFDLLTEHGVDVTARPLRERRHRLEELFRDVLPPLQLTLQTTDLAIARQWLDDYASAPLGVDGPVIKGLALPYLPGRRGWLKYRIRDTYEVIVAAVTGTLEAPDRLVLGLYDTAGELIVAGGTVALKAGQRAEVRPLLRPPEGRHPWPAELPVGRMGVFGGGTVPVTRVEPFVVEVAADQSFDFGRWRHLARFIRARPDLSPAETSGPMG